ncbi:hypothetical protein D3C71_1079910 [compost metagenome]
MRIGVEAVAFGRVVQRLHRHAGFPQRRFHPPGVLDRGAFVFATGSEEYRHLDAVGQIHRRYRRQLLPVTDPFLEIVFARTTPLDVAGGEHDRQVIDTDIPGRTTVQTGLFGSAHHRRVATITGAIDADPRGVGDSLADSPAGCIGEIVLHGAAPLAGASGSMGAPVIARSTEVDLQHRITRVSEHLADRVVAAGIERTVRPPVRDHHHRLPVGIAFTRHRQVAVQGKPITRLESHRAHDGSRNRVDPAAAADDMVGFLCLIVEDVEVARVAT